MTRFWIQRRRIGGELAVDLSPLDEHTRFGTALGAALEGSRREPGAVFDVHDCDRDEGPFGLGAIVATALHGRVTDPYGEQLTAGPDGEPLRN